MNGQRQEPHEPTEVATEGRDGKNTENPSRLSILLPWFCCLRSPYSRPVPRCLSPFITYGPDCKERSGK